VEIDDYIRVIRAHRVLIVLAILGGYATAGVLAWTHRPTYEASTQLFASAGGIPGKRGNTYEAERYAEERMRSYAPIISGTAGAEAVGEQLGLRVSVESIRREIRVSVPPRSALANITVRDPSPGMAKAIADALGEQAPRLIDAFESPGSGERSPLHVTVTRRARLPTAPAAPRIIYIALGALLGLVGGIGGALLADALDNRIRGEADARRLASAPVLGRIGRRWRHQPSTVMWGYPSARAEAYRSLRANLVAMGGKHDLRAFMVSSAVAGEGKTEVVANLGLALAQAGERVVVVDANLRAPRLAALLNVRSSVGLTDLLAGAVTLDMALRAASSESLEVLASGTARPNPTQVLEDGQFETVLQELTDRFAWVIVDAPALLPVTDALIIAREALGVILVARAASTSRNELGQATQALRLVETQVLGVVLNGVSSRDTGAHRNDMSARPDSRPAMVASL
jgi:capsular exopolysaccharide synthesis family protein